MLKIFISDACIPSKPYFSIAQALLSFGKIILSSCALTNVSSYYVYIYIYRVILYYIILYYIILYYIILFDTILYIIYYIILYYILYFIIIMIFGYLFITGSFIEETPSYRKWTFSLAQRSLCPVGMCLKRSWSHILTGSEIVVSSWHVP